MSSSNDSSRCAGSLAATERRTSAARLSGIAFKLSIVLPELGTSIFVIPRDFVKNARDRCAVLNRIARSVVDKCRGRHSEFVFARNGNPLTRIYNSGCKGARRRALARYEKEFGRPCPAGFRSIRVHDLKHTFGPRLRVAGVSFEDRKPRYLGGAITRLAFTSVLAPPPRPGHHSRHELPRLVPSKLHRPIHYDRSVRVGLSTALALRRLAAQRGLPI